MKEKRIRRRISHDKPHCVAHNYHNFTAIGHVEKKSSADNKVYQICKFSPIISIAYFEMKCKDNNHPPKPNDIRSMCMKCPGKTIKTFFLFYSSNSCELNSEN